MVDAAGAAEVSCMLAYHSRDLAVVVAAADGFSGDQVRGEESDEEETNTETTHWAISLYARTYVTEEAWGLSANQRTNSDCVVCCGNRVHFFRPL